MHRDIAFCVRCNYIKTTNTEEKNNPEKKCLLNKWMLETVVEVDLESNDNNNNQSICSRALLSILHGTKSIWFSHFYMTCTSLNEVFFIYLLYVGKVGIIYANSYRYGKTICFIAQFGWYYLQFGNHEYFIFLFFFDNFGLNSIFAVCAIFFLVYTHIEARHIRTTHTQRTHTYHITIEFCTELHSYTIVRRVHYISLFYWNVHQLKTKFNLSKLQWNCIALFHDECLLHGSMKS